MLATGRVPSESEQITAYRQAAAGVGDRLLVLRTFDVGAEKVIDGIQDDTDINPALGVRGLRRHLLRVPEELRTQLRAVLIATAGANAAILLPMVTNVDDVRRARAHLAAVLAELEAEGSEYNRALRVAAMIEVPAAALSVREILAEVDFVSVGTNDMVQYLAAADRDNPAVLPYLDPVRSGLFRLLEWVLAEARAIGRADSVLVGGEVASDPVSAARLARIGLRGLIVHPGAVDAVRAAIEKE
jgi:phosphoenolpyruvate-protein kinase (PTS system EI component)